jgi:hypothetical protein
LYLYDPASGRLTASVPLPSPFTDGLVATNVGAKLVFRTDVAGQPSTLSIYDTVTRSFSPFTFSVTPYSPHDQAVVGGKMIIFGQGALMDGVTICDLTTGQTYTSTVAAGHSQTAAVVVGKQAIFAGGGTGTNLVGPSAAVDIYTDTAPTAVLSADLTGNFGGRDKITVINTGDADLSGQYTIKLYASADRTLNGAILVGTRDVASPIAAGASSPFIVRSVVPVGAPAGTYHLLATVTDSTGHETPVAAEDAVLTVRGARAATAKPGAQSAASAGQARHPAAFTRLDRAGGAST